MPLGRVVYATMWIVNRLSPVHCVKSNRKPSDGLATVWSTLDGEATVSAFRVPRIVIQCKSPREQETSAWPGF